jgi:hypothetical protein
MQYAVRLVKQEKRSAGEDSLGMIVAESYQVPG